MAHLVQDWGSFALRASTYACLVYIRDGVYRGLTFVTIGGGLDLGLDCELTGGRRVERAEAPFTLGWDGRRTLG